MISIPRVSVVGMVLALSVMLLGGCGSREDADTQAVPAEPAEPAAPQAAVTPPVMPVAMDVRHVDAAGAQQLLATNPAVVVLDVRTPAEYVGGHIAGSTNIDFGGAAFATDLARLDRDRTYLVHCASGGRSTKSLAVLQKLGFRTVVHLDGGYNAWVKAGNPVQK